MDWPRQRAGRSRCTDAGRSRAVPVGPGHLPCEGAGRWRANVSREGELQVTTYDSAYLHMERHGARFGIVVFDECHHLPGETYALAARLYVATGRPTGVSVPALGGARMVIGTCG